MQNSTTTANALPVTGERWTRTIEGPHGRATGTFTVLQVNLPTDTTTGGIEARDAEGRVTAVAFVGHWERLGDRSDEEGARSVPGSQTKVIK